MIPLNTYYEQEVRKWLISNSGRSIIIYEVVIYEAALFKAVTTETAVQEFKVSGIFPFNLDHLYAPS